MAEITIKEVHDIMENELRCVQRASVNGCDRECDKCDLLMDADKIVKAYCRVLSMIEYNSEYIIARQKEEMLKKLSPRFSK